MDTSGIESAIDGFFAPVSDAVSTVVFYEVTIGSATFPIIVGWLVLAAAIFTVAFRGIQAWGVGHAIALVRGRYGRDDDPGEVSHFQALTSRSRAPWDSATSPEWRSHCPSEGPGRRSG